MRFLLPFLLALTCHAQQALLLSGVATVPLPTAVASGPTNTTAGLVNWWKFDEDTGTTTADSAGSAGGTFGGSGTTWVAGQIGSALHYSGVGRVVFSTNTTTSGNLTISLWINPEEDAGMIFYDSDNDTSKGLWIELFSGGVIFESVFNSVDLERHSTTGIISQSVWSHLLVTWAGDSTAPSSVHIYLNAAETSYSGDVTGVGTHLANNGATTLTAQKPPSLNDDYAGIIDTIQVWNRVLSYGEITNMYSLGLMHLNQ